MSSNSEKKVAGHLYAEIALLKQQFLEWDDERRTELSTWTKQCGQLGNEIGRLRRQLVTVNIDHQEILCSWTARCGQLGNEIGRLRKEILAKEVKHQTELEQLNNKNGQLRQQLVDVKVDHRKQVLDNKVELQTKCERLNSEICRLRQQLLDKETELDLEVNESVETATDNDNQMKSLDSKLLDMNLENESLAEHTMECQQFNDATVIATIKPCDDSYSLDSQHSLAQNTTNNVDAETKDSAVELTNTIKGCDQSLVESISDQQIQEDEETKVTPKRSIWNSLKKSVTPKRKYLQSSPH